MIWDILFSPFGADRRFVLAYFMCLMALIYPALYSANGVDDDDDRYYYLEEEPEEFYDEDLGYQNKWNRGN